jgi:hypothetical protein
MGPRKKSRQIHHLSSLRFLTRTKWCVRQYKFYFHFFILINQNISIWVLHYLNFVT